MFISITFTEISIDETNKTQQKVRGSKFMFKMAKKVIHDTGWVKLNGENFHFCLQQLHL